MNETDSSRSVTLLAVGDIGPRTEETTKEIFDYTAPVLRTGDIVFGQLERVLSSRGDRRYNPGLVENAEAVATALADAGFTVISVAGNHHLDAGMDCFIDTMEILKEKNIHPLGVGMNIAEARTPTIIDHNGVKVAMLGYSSVLSRGEHSYEALVDKPGCVPMFINTHYEAIDYQPGTEPITVTTAVAADLNALTEDIRSAKEKADVVVMSIHWGVHHIESEIADYQYEVGHAAIDAGADLILGHHAHVLKGFEVYKGKVIFHCLGNFASETGRSYGPSSNKRWGREFHKTVPGWEKFTDPPESRQTVIAKCVISAETKQIDRVSFLPCMINQRAQAMPLTSDDERWTQVYEYVEWANKGAGIDTKFLPDGDEVVVVTS